MIWEKIRGHDELIAMFRSSVKRGRVSHAYLFVGPEGVGKRLFAQTLAQCLFCERFGDAELDACGQCGPCRMMQAGTHPDFLTLSRPEGKNVIPVELIAGEQGRRGQDGFCHDIAMRPMAGERRIAVIDDADVFNAESANALLKTLEEPPPGSILILIATNIETQMPTIRSRCQPVRFGPLPDPVVAELLVELEMTSNRDEAERAARFADGSITAATRLLDPKLRSLRDLVYSGLCEDPYRGSDFAARVQAGLDEFGGDAPEQRRLAAWVVRFVAEFFRLTLRTLADVERPACDESEWCQILANRLASAPEESMETLADLVDRAVETEEQITSFTSVPQSLEGLFLEIGQRLRAASPTTR